MANDRTSCSAPGYSASPEPHSVSALTGEYPSRAWPAGCIKPNSCARHNVCMYSTRPADCIHYGKDLTAEVASATEARRAETQSGSVHEGAVREAQTPPNPAGKEPA